VLKDGWLYTGDVAVMDADGYFEIISRKRDTIMAGDYSVYPRDAEEVLYENSKVMEVAVVGVACEEEKYAVPWDIEFREELPKSFVGKVLRRSWSRSTSGGSLFVKIQNRELHTDSEVDCTTVRLDSWVGFLSR
jgi:hypothetical protein